MEEGFENKYSRTMQIGEIINDECQEIIEKFQEENYALKNKLAVTQEILRRYKLNEVTELLKELVIII